MERVGRRVGVVFLGLAAADLALLHTLPAPMLHATTGTMIPYRPWNFLSEYARTQYAPLMTGFFFLAAAGTAATAATVRTLRREAVLLAVAGVALALLGVFPTDLADLSTDAVTCELPGRIEPCTIVGRIHNPLSTFVFVPIALAALCFCSRSRTEVQWRGTARLALVCGIFALSGIAAAAMYLHAIGWHGRWWTGLMQRSLVFPAFVWMAGLLRAVRPDTVDASRVSSTGFGASTDAALDVGTAAFVRHRFAASRTKQANGRVIVSRSHEKETEANDH